ncbi:YetF domain-containing protein [Brassicibacter mesophilus]|uniref:YetF domain-containing protein n=1 Tax=Brassicibacter mesophilus TaxID=745119 RepID=UPI003D1D6339
MPHVFGVIKDISLIGYVIRTFIVGIIVYFVGRFIFKRAINQLTIYDFVLVWILGALTVAPLLDGKISFTYIIIPLLTLFFWHYIISIISMKYRNIAEFFNGKPVILIENGKIIKKNMKKHFVNIDILISELRLKNIFNLSEVKYVILEPNGHLSVMKSESHQPVTPRDMDLTAKPIDLPVVIINDGNLIKENLHAQGVDINWLFDNLAMYGISTINEVFLATLDKNKRLYVSKND